MGTFASSNARWRKTRFLLAAGALVSLSVGSGQSAEISNDTNWTAAGSPYVIANNLTVAAGATLTIEPGVTVQLGNGAGLTVNGRIIAEGNETNRIRFIRAGAAAWSRILIQNSPIESRFVWCDIDGAGDAGNITAIDTVIYLDHVVFTNTPAQLVNLEHSSCVIQHCRFPSIQDNELLHFFRMPPNGHALIASNLFGTPGIPATSGYNDVIDFAGGNRPGPIVQIIGNIFLSGVDDGFDLDGADGHIEGNVFMNIRQDARRDTSSSPITTGEDNFGGTDTSELVICRNIFYDCEHMLLLKDGGSALVQNNTIIRLTTNPNALTDAGQPIPPGIILFGEPWRGRPPGAGAIFEGNIAYDLAPGIQADPFPLFSPADSFLTVSHSLIEGANWPGEGNLSVDPMFVSLTNLDYLNIRSNLVLLSGSPAIGTGPNGIDMGALVSEGATISGTPAGATTNGFATLRVAGPGVFSYKWRINGGSWSEEVPLTTNLIFSADMFANAPPIVLTNLGRGSYALEVMGRNSAGSWQREPTVSRWSVVRPHPPLPPLPGEVGGLLTSNTTWSSAGCSPLPCERYVVSDVIVPANVTLTIEAGVRVFLTNQASIRAIDGGRINVVGTSSNPVVFESMSGTNLWGGILAQGTNSSLTISHGEIIRGQVAVFSNATALLEDTYLHDYRVLANPDTYNQPILITERAGPVIVRRCRFREYHETLFRYGLTTVEDSLFENIHGDGVDFDYAVPGSAIRRCTFRHGNGTNIDAVDIGSASRGVLIEECLMYDFPFDKGVSIGEQSLDVTVRNCVIYGVDAGVAVKDSSAATIYHNTIVGANHGLNLYEKVLGQGGGHATAWNNILWDNGNSISLANGSTISTSYSDISGAGIYPGTNNFNIDPLFLDPAQQDYRLATNSPVLGLGVEGTNPGALPGVGSLLVDTDGDRLPDPWEWGNGLDLNDAGDADLDPDADGLTNWQEFVGGTDPRDASSVLKFDAVEWTVDSVRLHFMTAAGKSYSIQYRDNLANGGWQKLADVAAQPGGSSASVTNPVAPTDAARFYRLVTPQQP